jgi:hypothetical protein
MFILLNGLVQGDFSCAKIERSDTVINATTRSLSRDTRDRRAIRYFKIDLLKGNGLRANQAASAAFDTAARLLEDLLGNTVVDSSVKLAVDLAVLQRDVIGATSSVNLIGPCSSPEGVVPDQLAAKTDHSYPDCTRMNFSLPVGMVYRGNVLYTKAQLKTLGFTGLDSEFGRLDGRITFNSQFGFDFNVTDGVAPDKIDFLSVALHEIMHALGFVSEVDTVDIGRPGEYFPTLLDLSRFRDYNIQSYTTAQREANPGRGPHIFFSPKLPVEETGKAGIELSRGYATGDGNQASHWKANDITGVYIGVMDPTLGSGESLPITKADALAFREIGYTINEAVVPMLFYARRIAERKYMVFAQLTTGSFVKCRFDTNIVVLASYVDSNGKILCTAPSTAVSSLAIANDNGQFSNSVRLS